MKTTYRTLSVTLRARLNAQGTVTVLPYLLGWDGLSTPGRGFIYGLRASGDRSTVDSSPFQVVPANGAGVSVASADGGYLLGQAFTGSGTTV